jgi:nicotinamide mononucleotide transporter
MKITDFLKKEFTGWKPIEVGLLVFAIVLILYNLFVLHDNVISVISAICGILYTIIAGKGKISCYLFGVCGSGCYAWLALKSLLYGNLILYLGCYIPAQIYGFFSWKKNLKVSTMEIVKTELSIKEKLILFILSVIGCLISIFVLYKLHDNSPVMDGITTFLSIIGMYLTVKRCLEQWFVWMIVNGLSLVMWIYRIMSGVRAYSTLVMWAVYFVLAVYFFVIWRKEIINNKKIAI